VYVSLAVLEFYHSFFLLFSSLETFHMSSVAVHTFSAYRQATQCRHLVISVFYLNDVRRYSSRTHRCTVPECINLLKKEAARFSETSVSYHITTRMVTLFCRKLTVTLPLYAAHLRCLCTGNRHQTDVAFVQCIHFRSSHGRHVSII
jgi:hypothetical protein